MYFPWFLYHVKNIVEALWKQKAQETKEKTEKLDTEDESDDDDDTKKKGKGKTGKKHVHWAAELEGEQRKAQGKVERQSNSIIIAVLLTCVLFLP